MVFDEFEGGQDEHGQKASDFVKVALNQAIIEDQLSIGFEY